MSQDVDRSEWLQGAAARRDFRATHDDAPPRAKVGGRTKDRRRFCGGHEGRVHAFVMESTAHWLGYTIREWRCQKCGQKRSHWERL